jgi:paraquat-inducible protein B
MPLEDIGENLNRSLAQLSTTLENAERATARLDEEVLPSLAAATRDASALMSPTSTINTELRRLLLELTEAARSLRLAADYLERHPESLIRGKEGGQ